MEQISPSDSDQLDQKKKPILVILGYLVIFLLVIMALGFIGFYAFFNLFGSATKTNMRDLGQQMQQMPDGWIKYYDPDMAISFEYPGDWKLIDTGETLDLQKNSNDGVNGMSISESFKFGRMPKPQNMSLQQVLASFNRNSDVMVMEDISVNQKIYEAPHQADSTNIHTLSHYWDTDNWVYYMDGIYYDQMHDHDTDPVLKRMLESVTIQK